MLQPTRVEPHHRAARCTEIRRRDKRLDFGQHRAGAFDPGKDGRAGRRLPAVGQKQRRRVGDLRQTIAGHFEHADLVGRAEAVLDRTQDAELVAAFAFEIEDGVHHVFHHARPRDLAFLGDMPDKDDGNPPTLGKGHQFMGGGTDLGHGAGRGVDGVEPHGLDRINHGQMRAFGIQRGQDVAQRGFRAKRHGGIGQAQTLGPHADLGRRLFARDVEAFQTPAGETGGGLQQEGGFPDAGVAPDEDGRGRDEATAQHAVQFIHPACGAGRRRFGRRKIAERNGPSPGGRRTGAGGKGGFLDDAVPGAAGIAAARPFPQDRAAGGAGEAGG